MWSRVADIAGKGVGFAGHGVSRAVEAASYVGEVIAPVPAEDDVEGLTRSDSPRPGFSNVRKQDSPPSTNFAVEVAAPMGSKDDREHDQTISWQATPPGSDSKPDDRGFRPADLLAATGRVSSGESVTDPPIDDTRVVEAAASSPRSESNALAEERPDSSSVAFRGKHVAPQMQASEVTDLQRELAHMEVVSLGDETDDNDMRPAQQRADENPRSTGAGNGERDGVDAVEEEDGHTRDAEIQEAPAVAHLEEGFVGAEADVATGVHTGAGERSGASALESLADRPRFRSRGDSGSMAEPPGEAPSSAERCLPEKPKTVPQAVSPPRPEAPFDPQSRLRPESSPRSQEPRQSESLPQPQLLSPPQSGTSPKLQTSTQAKVLAEPRPPERPVPTGSRERQVASPSKEIRERAELLSAELRAAHSREADLAGEVRRLTHTNLQLKQMIDQMREVSRAYGEETSSLQRQLTDAFEGKETAERDAALAMHHNSELHARLEQAMAETDVHSAWAEEKGMLVQQLKKAQAEADLTMERTHLSAETTSAKIASLQAAHQAALQRERQLQSSVKTLTADLALANQDRARLEQALGNMSGVLEEFRAEKDTDVQVVEARLREQMASQAAEFEATKLELEVESRFLEGRKAAEQELQAERRSRVRAEGEITRVSRDLHKSRAALDDALQKLQGKHEDAVDRQLVTNLITRYITARDKRQVLELMARMFNFTDGDKEAVGLLRSAPSIPGMLTAIFSPAEEDHKISTSEIEGNSLADMWMDFLLSETMEADEPN